MVLKFLKSSNSFNLTRMLFYHIIFLCQSWVVRSLHQHIHFYLNYHSVGYLTCISTCITESLEGVWLWKTLKCTHSCYFLFCMSCRHSQTFVIWTSFTSYFYLNFPWDFKNNISIIKHHICIITVLWGRLMVTWHADEQIKCFILIDVILKWFIFIWHFLWFN